MKKLKLLTEDSVYKNTEITLKLPIYVTCIDASKKPRSILPENWLIENEEYTVISKYNIKNGDGFILNEVSPMSHLFEGYSSNRFGMTDEQIEENLIYQRDLNNANNN